MGIDESDKCVGEGRVLFCSPKREKNEPQTAV